MSEESLLIFIRIQNSNHTEFDYTKTERLYCIACNMSSVKYVQVNVN